MWLSGSDGRAWRGQMWALNKAQAGFGYGHKRPVSLIASLEFDFMQENALPAWGGVLGFESVNICFKLAKMNNGLNFMTGKLSLKPAFERRPTIYKGEQHEHSQDHRNQFEQQKKL